MSRQDLRETAARRRSAATPQAEPALSVSLVPLLLILVVISSVALVQSSHRARKLFSELQDLRQDALQLEEEWGRLLLEQSTWASPDRVQRLAEDELGMTAPDMRKVIMVRGYGKAG